MQIYRAMVAGMLLSLSAGPLFADDIQGVTMKDGKMMVMADGKTTGPMQKELTTTDGQKVMTDGTIKKADGTTSHMQDGQVMMKNGTITAADGEKGMKKGMGMGMGMKDKGMGMGQEKMKEGMDMPPKSSGDKPPSATPQE